MRTSHRWAVEVVLAAAIFAGDAVSGAGQALIRVPADLPTLQQAIAAVSDGGVIELATGTYTPPTGGFEIKDLNKSFVLRAAAGGVPVIDGLGTRPLIQYRNSFMRASQWLTFEGLTLRNGFASDGSAGGLTMERAQGTFVDCRFENNRTDVVNGGGGGLIVGLESKALIVNCVFAGNSAKFYGGGMSGGSFSEVYIHGCLFSGNRTNLPGHRPTASGGAIHISNSILHISNSRFEDNRAGYVGGAIYLFGEYDDNPAAPASRMILSNCTFDGNVAQNDPGVVTPGPPESGAIHIENDTIADVYSSRFFGNSAMAAGALGVFRAKANIYHSVFVGNTALGQGTWLGYGGAISLTSNDGPDATTNFGTINRPPGELTIEDTLIEGPVGGAAVSEAGGGIYVGGDAWSLYGENGMPQNGTAATNRAIVTLRRVVLAGLTVTQNALPTSGIGAGMLADLTDLVVEDCLFLGSDAVGASGSGGGGLAVINQSDAWIRDTTIVACTAGSYGAAVFVQGSNLDLGDSELVENEISPGVGESVGQSYGSATFSVPEATRNAPVTGDVHNNLISRNVGLPFFDDDDADGPINDLHYNQNSIYSTTFGATVYTDSLPGYCCRSIADLNSLVITRQLGTPSTTKSSLDNVALGSASVVARLLATPAWILPSGAVGDPAGPTEAFLGLGWSGAPATLDGSGVTGNALVVDGVPAGTHTLVAGAAQDAATTVTRLAPGADLDAVPATIPIGQAADLEWTAFPGSFLGGYIDQAIGGVVTPSGSVAVSPQQTRTYRFYQISKEGGAVATTQVQVGCAQPRIVSFTASTVLVSPGGSSTLTWSTTGATTVRLNGVVQGSLSGSTLVAPGATTTYTLAAENACGAVSAKVTVNVAGGQASPPRPTISAPSANAVIGVAGVSFAWSVSSGASGYDLRLFDRASGNTLFSGTLAGATSTTTIIALANGGYLFAVRACSGGFSDATCSLFRSVAFSVNLIAPTGAPAILAPATGAELTASTIAFSWTAVAKADASLPLYYELLVDNVAAGTTAVQIRVPDPTLSSIHSLQSSAHYRARVRACHGGCGPYSEPADFAITLGPVPSTAPSITSAVVSGGNQLTVNWTAVPGADIYQIQVVQPSPAGPGGGALTVAARQVSETTATFSVPAGPATIFLQACNGDGCGPFAPTQDINAAGPNPSVASLGTPMAQSTVAGPEVIFTWNRVAGDNGSNTFYRLYVQDLSRQSAALDLVTTQNYWATNLRAEGAVYDALVVANPGPSQVVGPPSTFAVRGVSAATPTMVEPTHQTQVSAGNILFRWSPVEGANLYEYYVAVCGVGSATARGVTPGLFVQVPLSATPPFTTYCSIARACPAGATCTFGSDSGWGPWNDALVTNVAP